jgi:hypothetical protein
VCGERKFLLTAGGVKMALLEKYHPGDVVLMDI